MKRIISIFLSVLTVFTLCFSVNVNAEDTYTVYGTHITDGELVGEATASSTANYSFRINPNTHYDYPSEITVKVGRTNLTEGYTYDSTTGVGSIEKEYITDNIDIWATCSGAIYGVPTVNITNGTCVNNTETTDHKAQYGAALKLKLSANEGFTLPSSITVTIGGATYAGTNYYDSSTGEVLISGDDITGAVVVTAVCQSSSGETTYAVTNSITNGTFSGSNSATSNTNYTCSIVANDGYSLPSTISMTIGGVVYTGFEYDSKTGTVSVPSSDVAGDIKITAECVSNTYTVTQTGRPGVGYTFTGATTATKGQNYTFNIIFDEDNYDVEDFKALVDGKEVEITYTGYDIETGFTCSIAGNDVTGNIEIYIYCETRVEHLVGLGFTDITSETPHLNEVYYLISTGISEGWTFEDGSKEFRPLAPVARADMAAFLKRLAFRLGDNDSKDYSPSGDILSVFTDVDVTETTTYHQADILWLAENEIAKGWAEKDGTTTFRPFESVARADAAAFLRRIARKYNVADAATWTPTEEDWAKFPDVTQEGDYHQEDILWLAHAGIAKGFEDGEFKPFNSIARCDMAAFIIRLNDLVERN